MATAAKDDHDRVRRSVQELERNTRQVTDFADGVLKDITTVHLGKSLTLSEMVQEVLKVEFTIPTTIKTGGYVLASSQETCARISGGHYSRTDQYSWCTSERG